MFEDAVAAPPMEEQCAAFPDRPEGWTAEDEQLLVEEDYRRWSRTAPPEPGPAHDDPPGWAALESAPAHEQPSGWAAFELDIDTTDPSQLSDARLIDGMVGCERTAAWAEARQARLMAEFARRRPSDDPALAGSDRLSATSPYAPDEVGLALRLSRWSAKARIGQSLELVHRLPETLQAWENGQLDERRVTAICDATRNLSPEKARAVQHRVLGRASEQTAAQLRAALNRAVLSVDPDGAAERHRKARRDRRVAVGDERDGMASLWALLSAPDARSAYQWLSRLARGIGIDDPRGMDARRADLLVDLLTGQLTYAAPATEADEAARHLQQVDETAAADRAGASSGSVTNGDSARADCGVPGGSSEAGDDKCGTSDGGSHASRGCADAGCLASADGGACAGPGGPHGAGDGAPRGAASVPPRPVNPGKPLVQVVMPFSTLIGADDQPCELVGHGAVPADLAREIAADAVLKRLVYDPLSGALLDHGRTTYRPPAALADFIRARDVYCRSPICRRRAIDGELDHIVPYPEGPTSADNMAGCCTHDHHMKHAPGWQVRAHDDGGIEWITPTGHSYLSHPHDYRPDEPFRLPPPPTEASPPPPEGRRPPSNRGSDGVERRAQLAPHPTDHVLVDDGLADPPPF
jgi:hypothetical protein